MKAEIKNANIRGCKCGINKSGEPYILVYAEDEDGNSGELIDKNMERKDIYKKNTVVDIKADIGFGKYAAVRIIDILQKEQTGDGEKNSRKKGRRGITEDIKNRVENLYNNDNLTCVEITKVCNISESSVFRIMRERRQIMHDEET